MRRKHFTGALSIIISSFLCLQVFACGLYAFAQGEETQEEKDSVFSLYEGDELTQGDYIIVSENEAKALKVSSSSSAAPGTADITLSADGRTAVLPAENKQGAVFTVTSAGNISLPEGTEYDVYDETGSLLTENSLFTFKSGEKTLCAYNDGGFALRTSIGTNRYSSFAVRKAGGAGIYSISGYDFENSAGVSFGFENGTFSSYPSLSASLVTGSVVEEQTVYIYTASVTNEKNYVILNSVTISQGTSADRNSPANDDGVVANTEVTLHEADSYIAEKYVTGAPSNAVWYFEDTGSGIAVSNGSLYLNYSGGLILQSDFVAPWTYSDGRLSGEFSGTVRYLRLSSGNWTGGQTKTNAYLFEETTAEIETTQTFYRYTSDEEYDVRLYKYQGEAVDIEVNDDTAFFSALSAFDFDVLSNDTLPSNAVLSGIAAADSFENSAGGFSERPVQVSSSFSLRNASVVLDGGKISVTPLSFDGAVRFIYEVTAYGRYYYALAVAVPKSEAVIGKDDLTLSGEWSPVTYNGIQANQAVLNAQTPSGPTASFTFKGTSFDLNCTVSDDTGIIFVKVYSAGGELLANYFVDTHYGCQPDSDAFTWVQTGKIISGVPVIRSENFDYGTYNVVIEPRYSSFFDANGFGYSKAIIESVTVYNPCGDAGSMDSVVKAAYMASGDLSPVYLNIKNSLVSAEQAFDVGSLPAGAEYTGGLLVDGLTSLETDDYETFIKKYKVSGPNNEVYLAKGQAVVFNISVTGATQPAKALLGAKIAFDPGESASVLVMNKNSSSYTSFTLDSFNTAFFDITGNITWNQTESGFVSAEPIVIFNNSDSVVSLTDIKLSFSIESAPRIMTMSVNNKILSKAGSFMRSSENNSLPEANAMLFSNRRVVSVIEFFRIIFERFLALFQSREYHNF
ncbi:MAG: hypothetical protein K6B52_07785 [Clostridiales bacterium]|nr:hypothetical protein [Clostridiales bacterium]